jgi:hypothetical protein
MGPSNILSTDREGKGPVKGKVLSVRKELNEFQAKI